MSDLNLTQLDPFENQLKELVSVTQGNTFAGAIAGDKPTLEAVKKNRIQLRDVRVAITKKGKELREDATEFSRKVIAREKELVGMITPEEDRLQRIEDEAKLQEVKRQQELKYPARALKLEDLNKMPHAEIIDVEAIKDTILRFDDVQFDTFYNKCFANNNDRARKYFEEQEEAKRNARIERLITLGLTFDFKSASYIYKNLIYVPAFDIQTYSEERWTDLVTQISTIVRESPDIPAQEEVVAGTDISEGQAVQVNNGVATSAEAKQVVTANPENLDKGHIALCKDISAVYRDAMNWEFNDFKNKKYPIPKVALVEMLQTIIERTKKGDYDN